MKSHRREYERRVNSVIDHIRAHLPEDLTLERLAAVAAFSPFHFHRVFKSITNETLFGYIQRLRMEKSAQALLIGAAPILDVALSSGFASAATFARAFKAHFGMSATEWRAGGFKRWRSRNSKDRKPGKALRKARKAMGARMADSSREPADEGRMRTLNVRIQELPTYRVAYMRYVGPYGAAGIPKLWKQFRRWTSAHGLESADMVALGVAYDNPTIAEPDKCRYDACVVIGADFPLDKRVNATEVRGGKYAVYDFIGTAGEITGAWDRTFRSWLPESGYQPDDRACIEIYRGDPNVDRRRGTFGCELCLPVKPL